MLAQLFLRSEKKIDLLQVDRYIERQKVQLLAANATIAVNGTAVPNGRLTGGETESADDDFISWLVPL